MNIAIFNAEARKAVSIIRSLGKEGYGLFTFSFERISFAAHSKYVRKNMYLRDFDMEHILAKLVEFKIDVILPIEDSSIGFFAKNRERFRRYTIIAPEYDVFILFADKANTVKLAGDRKVSVPSTLIPGSKDEALENLRNRDDYPVVIKPRMSTGSIGLKVSRDSNEAISDYREVSRRFHLPLIQQYIPPGGKTVGAEFLFYEGREILSFSHQRIREFPVDSGPSTYCKNYRKDDALIEGRKLFHGLNYSGFAMAEFKEHPETGELYLMEINPRPWGSITLPISMGLDFPVEAVKVFTDPAGYKPRTGVPATDPDGDYYMRWFLPGDFLSIMLDRRQSAGEKLKNIFKRYKNTSYQILSIDDPIPAIIMTLKLALNLFNFGYIRRYILRRW